MKKKNDILQNIRLKSYSYILTNRLFLTYVILAFVGCLCLRGFTIGNAFTFKSMITELGLILLIGSFGYLYKPNKQYRYYFICLCIFTLIFTANQIYYTFYANFASLGELTTLKQAETVTGSIFEKLKIVDFIYILIPLIFRQIHQNLRNSSYYNYLIKIEKGSKMFIVTLFASLALIGLRLAVATSSDFSRLAKLWNRECVVERFGILLYQSNDIVQTLTPKISSLFGYEDALKLFNDYYAEKEEKEPNKYTNIFEGKNVVFVHMESIQTFLMDLEFNGVEVTPTINKLAKEGMFFSNFYPQVSTGTSSDTEFTLLSSLMPAASGTIFVSYYDRNYITIPKLLKEKGYHTFSMHGNNKAMWNRAKIHPLLGYDEMYFEESFTYNEDDIINLGINDKLFFEQAIPILENEEKTYVNYMGTIITLSNHSPFSFLDKYGELDYSDTFKVINEATGELEEVTTNYLEGSAVGNYIHSAHYADLALGDFINYINNSEYFNDTIFVFYGDHDAKLSRNNLEYLYNYNKENGELLEDDDPNYVSYDVFDHELNKNTPLIVWSKNEKLRKKINVQIDDVMGMYDVMPTIGNMLGIDNIYALGHDMFDKNSEDIVVFPNGNFLTNEIYYRNSTGEYKILKENAVLAEDYIAEHLEYVDRRLEVSNAIVVYNLLSDESLSDAKSITKENE